MVETEEGIIENVSVFLSHKDAQTYFEECCKSAGLTVEEPYNDDYEVYISDGLQITEPRMVLAGHRRAMARLEALCS